MRKRKKKKLKRGSTHRKREWIKKKRRERQLYIQQFQDIIIENNDSIWTPDGSINWEHVSSDSWFDIRMGKNNGSTKVKIDKKLNKNRKTKADQIACKQVKMHLTPEQKTVINRWMNTYIMMYNKTLKYLKTQFHLHKNTEAGDNQHIRKTVMVPDKSVKKTVKRATKSSKTRIVKKATKTAKKTIKMKEYTGSILDYKFLRTHFLKDDRDKLIKESGLLDLAESKKSSTIKAHMLDSAMQLACANYKSGLTNLKNGNIRYFRIKYWKLNKDKKMLDIEHQYFKQGTICPKELGMIKCTLDGERFDLSTVRKSCKIHFDRLTGKYTLLVPESRKVSQGKKPNKIISLDPGVRTFQTGLSENECVEIGKNTSDTIRDRLKRIDKIQNNPNIPGRLKKKICDRLNRKIRWAVDDLHWKTCKYLTDRYEIILIGDMSVKGIVSRETSKLQKIVKRIAYACKFYQFRQRLEHKCKLNGNKYRCMDERFTSKLCSKCGYLDENLGGKKTFKCLKCKAIIDRDLNGCRNIYMKQFL
jgi:IS605 OrfB family transposase